MKCPVYEVSGLWNVRLWNVCLWNVPTPTTIYQRAEAGDNQENFDVVQDWTKTDPGVVGSMIPEFVQRVLSPDDEKTLEGLNSAYDFYKLIQTDEFAQEIVL